MTMKYGNTPILLAGFVSAFSPLQAGIELLENHNLYLEGDAKIRYENDATTRPGSGRRERLRLTSHLIVGYRPSEALAFRLGGRTGALGNQHTPTVTLERISGDQSLGDRRFYLDRWEIEYGEDAWRVLLGRTRWPFWSASGYIWDGDVNPAGTYGAYRWEGGSVRHSVAAAYYALPDGALSFTGEVGTVQYVARVPFGPGTFKAAVQWLQYEGGANAKYAKARNNERDYEIGQFSLAYQWEVWGQPTSAGFDVFRNFADYEEDDVFGFANRDEDSGFGLALSWGQNKKAGDWRVRYNYTYQETLSVNPSTSEDTFSRLGTSNYKGHGFRVIYSILDNLTIMARFMDSEEIKGDAGGDRFRIDTKFSF